MEEQVLVIERKVLESVGVFQGVMTDVTSYLKAFFAEGIPRFMPRKQVETDPGYKQLIPYVIMACKGLYFSYVRGSQGGEKRLVGLKSIGIGGHINPIDTKSSDFWETYLAAVDREVEEEVQIKTKHTDQIVALLNDESNLVGQVHLGIVHYWELQEPKVSQREDVITDVTFMSVADLRKHYDILETWSQLCCRSLIFEGN